MDALKEPHVYVVRGTPLQCGCPSGATPSDVQHCLAKMQCWARLAIATASAEFPEFTVMHAMSIFSLRPVDIADRRHVQDSVVSSGKAHVGDKLKTLADAFAVDLHSLSSQYHTTYTLAQTIAESTLNCGDREAWRRALRRCMCTRARSDVELSELVVVARAWLGWTTHTCDIERAFSQYQSIFDAKRRSAWPGKGSRTL